ncbi:MAG: methionyl-tRNA formyltransferase [Verrucomicrobiales bacterium]|nr:methionyl-tRNA formyltransferase [Verrucomicrobiales bacterium]
MARDAVKFLARDADGVVAWPRMRIIYIGSGEIGVPALRALLAGGEFTVAGVVTQPDRPAGRRFKLAASPVKQAALLDRVPHIFQPEKINADGVLAQLRELRPDLAVVCAYGQILRQPLLDLPRLGCLNIHASLLPKYRGAACVQAAVRNGDTVSGVTVMWMNAGLDTGDILLQRELAIGDDDTAGTVHDRLALLAPEALLAALRLIAGGGAPRIPQDGARASYAGKLRKEDGQVDWRRGAAEIVNHVRAMSPWPSAYTWLAAGGGRRMLKIHAAAVADGDGAAGTVLRADAGGVLVAAADGGVLLREVQLESRKRMPAAEFARGGQVRAGERFAGVNAR